MISAYPKIFTLGDRYVDQIFEDMVEVTEKVDGSQFGFGKIKGELVLRSKGRQIFAEQPDKLFEPAVKYILSIADRIPDGMFFYGETLSKPKHSTLAYDRTPKNNIALFAVCDESATRFNDYKTIKEYADLFEIEAVPVLYEGKVDDVAQVLKMLDTVSFLGGHKVEGIVVKNYHRELVLGGLIFPIMSGKYVSEEFKEVHRETWKNDNTSKGGLEKLALSYKTTARWHKAIQHLKESGQLTESPKDIGPLMKEIQKDIITEEAENIKEELYKLFAKDILRVCTNGFPEWYKKELLGSALPAVKVDVHGNEILIDGEKI